MCEGNIWNVTLKSGLKNVNLLQMAIIDFTLIIRRDTFIETQIHPCAKRKLFYTVLDFYKKNKRILISDGNVLCSFPE